MVDQLVGKPATIQFSQYSHPTLGIQLMKNYEILMVQRDCISCTELCSFNWRDQFHFISNTVRSS